jgi:DNA-binding NarL/FixJ family response regulator
LSDGEGGHEDGAGVHASYGSDIGTLSLLLTTSHRLVRDALAEAFENLGRLRIVATARDARETIAEAERQRPAVAVISDDIGRSEYLHATRMIVERVRSCAVLLLVGNEDSDALTDAIEAGARGYITRGVRLNQLCHAVERVASGGVVIPDAMVRPLLDRLVERRVTWKEDDQVLSLLSAREREVLLLLAEGASSESIAKTLVISRDTARKHVQNILVKMGVRSRLEAVAYVAQDGRRALLRAGG